MSGKEAYSVDAYRAQQRLQHLRADGWNYVQLEDYLGITRRTLAALEQGRRVTCDPATLIRIIDSYIPTYPDTGVDYDDYDDEDDLDDGPQCALPGLQLCARTACHNLRDDNGFGLCAEHYRMLLDQSIYRLDNPALKSPRRRRGRTRVKKPA